jgi:hypothetical protein
MTTKNHLQFLITPHGIKTIKVLDRRRVGPED